MLDFISLTSLIVSSITAIGVVIHQVHLKNCSFCCVNSNCSKTPPTTPKTPLLS